MTRFLAFLAACALSYAAAPFHQAEFVFPLEHWHNHSSSVVEAPDGSLLVCWYNGSGERTADDVRVLAAWKRRGSSSWSKPFLLADTPGFPDTNPILFVDAKTRLWLVWPVILANRWETALLKYRIASDWYRTKDRAPHWDVSDNMLFIPTPAFEPMTKAFIDKWLPRLEGKLAEEVRATRAMAPDKYAQRMGWMPRTHPLQLPSGRILMPLYSDGFNFSLVAYTDDGGKTWRASDPIIGPGAVQPSIVRRKDGSLVAYMRDNGPAPKRVLVAECRDNGLSWSEARDTDIPNSGTSVEVIGLEDGSWLMVNNDTEQGRHSLTVSISNDEGATWRWRRHLELDKRASRAGSFHYPSVIQARDGSIHVTYSYFLNHVPEGQPRKSIKHARFNVEWVKQGD